MIGFRQVPTLAILALSLSSHSFSAFAAGDAEKGRDLAAQQCTRCHVVGNLNPHGGIDSTPSFALLLQFEDYVERFRTFFARRPHPVFVRIEGAEIKEGPPLGAASFTISSSDLDNLLAYVERLRAAN